MAIFVSFLVTAYTFLCVSFVFFLTSSEAVFDIRHHVLLRSINAHTSAINCIVLNNIENYFVTASAEGEIKVSHCVK